MFIRIYRLEMQSVMSVFRLSFVNCCPSNLLSGSIPPFPVWISILVYTSTHRCFVAVYIPFLGGKSRCVGEKFLNLTVCPWKFMFPVTIHWSGRHFRSLSNWEEVFPATVSVFFLFYWRPLRFPSRIRTEAHLFITLSFLSGRGLCEIEIAEALSLELGYRAGLVCWKAENI